MTNKQGDLCTLHNSVYQHWYYCHSYIIIIMAIHKMHAYESDFAPNNVIHNYLGPYQTLNAA